MSIYSNGTYYQKNPNWHANDALWKANQIFKIIKKNKIDPLSICEIGCGSGQILNHLSQKMLSNKKFFGYDISPQAYDLCKKINNSNISFHLGDFSLESTERFDLLLIIDVIEHLEDYYGFLRSIQKRGQYFIFNIPLEIWIKAIFPNQLLKPKRYVGHLHFFTKELAISILEDTDYSIIDYSLIPSYSLIDEHQPFSSKFLRIPRMVTSKVSKELCSRIFGGCSLLILAKYEFYH